MALNKSDKEWITATFKSAILEAISPITEELNKHQQTLYGINLANGIAKEIEVIKEDHALSKAKMWKMVGIFSGAWIGLIGILSLVAKLIFKW